MAKGEGLVYYKWYFDKTRELEGFVKDGILTLEQAAELFFAVQAYAENGEMREMSSPYLVMIYKPLCKDADRAKQAYDDLVEKNRANGKKGVQGKAAKAAAKAEAEGAEAPPALLPTNQVKFSPPTLTQFKNAVEHFNGTEWDEEADYDDYAVEGLYDELKENNWIWNGRFKVQSRADWEKLLYERFSPFSVPYDKVVEGYNMSQWGVFKFVAERFPDGATLSEIGEVADNFDVWLDDNAIVIRSGYAIAPTLEKYIQKSLEKREPAT